MIAPARPRRLDQRSLIEARWRYGAVGAIVAGLLVLAVLGAIVFHGTTTQFDDRVAGRFAEHIGVRAAAWLLDVTNPAISVVLLLAVVVWALIARRVDLVALAAIAPALATFLAEEVLKPLIDREFGRQVLLAAGGSGSYPSGHETIATSTAVVVLIAACHLRLPRAVLGGVAAVLSVWVVAVAVGLVRNGFHYATDTIGAVGLSVAVVLGCALLIDRIVGKAQFTWRS